MTRLWAEGGRPGFEAPLAALMETAADVRVIVDATAAQAVAAQHARWLAGSVHVVSANKLAVGGAFGEWEALQAAASAGGTRYGDAATVGAGLPALSTLRRLTRAGRKQLEKEAREWERTTAILARFLTPGEEAP